MKKDKRILIPRDEFEEEAGEGLGRLSREEAEADLRELKARMEQRIRRPRAIWLPAAAAVVILVVASGILVSLLRERPLRDMRLAQKESSSQAGIIADTSYPGMTGEAGTDTALIAMAEPLEKKEDAPGEPAAPIAAGKIIPAPVAEAADEAYALVEEDAEANVAANEVVVTNEAIAANDVIMADEPVVQMIGAGEAEEVVVQALPQVTMTGMGARSKKADRDTAREAAGSKDIAKTEAGTEGRKDRTKVEAESAKEAAAAEVQGAGVPDTPVTPAVGWIEYQKWVMENIRYPESITPVVRQEVLVSFTVGTDSSISGLKTVSTPGLPFTREVFRLLQEGPQWMPARRGGEVTAEVVVLKIIFK